LLVVDDVVTRGATLLGAATLLQRRFASCDIAGFAAVRTISEAEVSDMFDPVVGMISMRHGQPHREP